MNISHAIGTLVKIALVAGCIYWLMKWNSSDQQDDADIAFAEKACVSEISSRYNTSAVRTYAANENSNGYVIRASITLPAGETAKVICLSNANGRVRELTIEER